MIDETRAMLRQRDRDWEEALRRASGDERPPLNPTMVAEWWGRVVTNKVEGLEAAIQELNLQIDDMSDDTINEMG